jgi:hypothetical protein
MIRRLAKQFLYGAFYIALWAILFAGVYFLFFKSPPSCFDGKRNQTEEGVDCGRICGNICLPADLKRIEQVGQVKILFPEPSRIGLLARLKNANPGHSARRVGFTFRIFDDRGEAFESSGNTFVYAGELKYLAQLVLLPPGFEKRQIVRAQLTLAEEEWAQAGDFYRPAVQLQEENTAVEANSIRVEGKVRNEDTLTLSNITILALFYGREGQLAGFSETGLDNFFPSETRPFVILHPPLTDVNPSATQIFISVPRL